MRKPSDGDHSVGHRARGCRDSGAEAWTLAQLLFAGGAGRPAGAALEETKDTIARLMRALRTERQRGKAGHWTYDLNRHIALSQALRRQIDRQRRLEAHKKKGRAPAEHALNLIDR